MQTVIPIPASKLNLAFREPWWEQFGITSGRSVTDLPIRQCLYFGTEAGRPGVAADNRNSLLTASYCDGPAVLFWEQFTGEVQPDVMFQAEEPVTPDLQAPAGMVAEVQKQLARMHGIDIPTPYWVAFMDWTRDPFGGGWHWWRVGQKSWEVVPRVLRPVADANLYVCGECWSPCQAWVEGALMTAESVLQRHLGLPWPEWLEPSAVLGT
jgi:monoamine oxidase